MIEKLKDGLAIVTIILMTGSIGTILGWSIVVLWPFSALLLGLLAVIVLFHWSVERLTR